MSANGFTEKQDSSRRELGDRAGGRAGPHCGVPESVLRLWKDGGQCGRLDSDAMTVCALLLYDH